jgi:hypothetical protein
LRWEFLGYSPFNPGWRESIKLLCL